MGNDKGKNWRGKEAVRRGWSQSHALTVRSPIINAALIAEYWEISHVISFCSRNNHQPRSLQSRLLFLFFSVFQNNFVRRTVNSGSMLWGAYQANQGRLTPSRAFLPSRKKTFKLRCRNHHIKRLLRLLKVSKLRTIIFVRNDLNLKDGKIFDCKKICCVFGDDSAAV